MFTPDNNSSLPLSSLTPASTYSVTGYAYSGGGRAVTRVEVSTDEGATWELAEIDKRVKPTPQGQHWAWVLWTLPLPTTKLVTSKSILCRATDCSSNTQPEKIVWNLMGMGNNC